MNKELPKLTPGNPPHHIAQIIIMNATNNILLELEGCLYVMPPYVLTSTNTGSLVLHCHINFTIIANTLAFGHLCLAHCVHLCGPEKVSVLLFCDILCLRTSLLSLPLTLPVGNSRYLVLLE